MTTTSESDRSRRRAFTVLGAAVAVLVVAAIALGASGTFATTSEKTTRHQAQAVVLELRAPGDVEIIATDGDTITVESRIRDLWGRVATEERVEDNTLEIESGCASGWMNLFNDCRVDYVLRVPAVTEISGGGSNGDVDVGGLRSSVDLATSNGDILAHDIEGAVRLASSNGAIEVSDVIGDLTLVSSNGSVRVADISAPEMVDVTTSNGAIEVSNTTGDLRLETRNGRIDILATRASSVFAETSNDGITIGLATGPERITARTDNGDIDIALPSDAPHYAIDTTTTNGTTEVEDVVDDPNAPFTIDTRTDNGDIHIAEAP